MKERIPRISIGLPVFNGERYLAGALDCLLRQDYEDFELIISDNASTDATGAICREYSAKDARIRYSRNEDNIGASPNYNKVFQLARGEFFKWASHDDECDSTLVRRCVEVFSESSESVVLVYSRADIIDEKGRIIGESPDKIGCSSPRPSERLAKVIGSSSTAHSLWGLIRSDALRQTRLMGCIEADHVLLAELAVLGQTVEIPEVLYRLRLHPGCAIPTNPSARGLLAWHDPRRANSRILLPHWERFHIEYLKGIQHVPLSAADRFRCFYTLLAVAYWRRFLRLSGPVRHQLGLRRRRYV
jgi:glycosyltransferase involved in cell wall biosynthesis